MIENFATRISFSSREKLYSQLGMLLSCSIELATAFEIMIAEEKNLTRKQQLHKIHDGILSGKLLSDCLNELFGLSPFEKATIEAGENTGRLSITISGLSAHLRNRKQHRKQFIMSLAYPAMIMITALIVVYFMMAYMVPMFEETFKRFNGELPAITVFVIRISELTRKVFPWLVTALFIIIPSCIILWKRPGPKNRISELLFRIPMISEIINRNQVTTFMSLMSTLTKSKVPLPDSLELSASALTFPVYKEKILKVNEEILHGSSLHEAMKASGIFKQSILSLVRISEETNSLGKGFSEIAEQYRLENEQRQTLLKSLLEPALILFMGLVAGTIVVSMYLPIIEMTVQTE